MPDRCQEDTGFRPNACLHDECTPGLPCTREPIQERSEAREESDYLWWQALPILELGNPEVLRTFTPAKATLEVGLLRIILTPVKWYLSKGNAYIEEAVDNDGRTLTVKGVRKADTWPRPGTPEYEAVQAAYVALRGIDGVGPDQDPDWVDAKAAVKAAVAVLNRGDGEELFREVCRLYDRINRITCWAEINLSGGASRLPS
jgi:hypothetical protein